MDICHEVRELVEPTATKKNGKGQKSRKDCDHRHDYPLVTENHFARRVAVTENYFDELLWLGQDSGNDIAQHLACCRESRALQPAVPKMAAQGADRSVAPMGLHPIGFVCESAPEDAAPPPDGADLGPGSAESPVLRGTQPGDGECQKIKGGCIAWARCKMGEWQGS